MYLLSPLAVEVSIGGCFSWGAVVVCGDVDAAVAFLSPGKQVSSVRVLAVEARVVAGFAAGNRVAGEIRVCAGGVAGEIREASWA